ncbi:MAG: HhH-GPD family protein [Parcubacteria group bacterium GW2011_GWA2_38_13]|nr:MAG: HhH-GPD family protein [Parcubacteria group bacterium GW2011_GWA2_38_13]
MKFFEKNIKKFYFVYGRKNLPWRKKVTDYSVWVSEIMLQQTQVSRVIEYYNNFLKKFPTIYHLARALWKEFFPYFKGLGYYRRAKCMLATAKIVVRHYGGIFPQEKTLLLALPGIGEYTANAILSFAFGKDVIAFDTNAKRVFGRFFYGSKNFVLHKEELEKKITLEKKVLNAAVMDFANIICTKKPKCEICPMRKKCMYYKTKGKKEFYAKIKPIKFPAKIAQVHLWLHKDHRKYYSANPDFFKVFILPAPVNTRENIKQYFKKKYKLEISVRPPHKKVYIEGIPTLFINAQILLGKHHFGVFKKEDLI